MFDMLGCGRRRQHCSSSPAMKSDDRLRHEIGSGVFVIAAMSRHRFLRLSRDQEHEQLPHRRGFERMPRFHPDSVAFAKGHFIAGAVIDEPGERLKRRKTVRPVDYPNCRSRQSRRSIARQGRDRGGETQRLGDTAAARAGARHAALGRADRGEGEELGQLGGAGLDAQPYSRPASIVSFPE